MSAPMLFEQPHKGKLFRLEMRVIKGKLFADPRKWWWDGADWQRSAQGICIPIEMLPAMHEAIGNYLAAQSSDDA